MSDSIGIKLAEIFVAEDRLRQVKPDFAQLYATMIQAGRIFPPIKVRRTPNGKLPFTLVSGGHRLEGVRLAGGETIEALVIKADKDGAREEEIEENLFRNELTALERIFAVFEYRRLFERKYGEVAPGNPLFANVAKLATLDLLGNIEDSQEGNFYARVTERLGISSRSTRRFCQIAKALCPQLRDVLEGSALEDNLSVIERLSKQDLGTQIIYANALRANGCDIAAADEAFNPKEKMSRDERAYEGLCDGWTRTNAAVRQRFIRDNLPAISDAVAADQSLLAGFVSRNREALEEALAAL